MSSGPQWAAEQEEYEFEQQKFQDIMVALAKIGCLKKYELINKFKSLKRSLNNLSDLRMTKTEMASFDEIKKFLEELGV